MRPSIHKGRESRFLLAVAALLFLATGAYLGAFLLRSLSALADAPLLPAFAENPPALWGVAVREERVIEALPGAQDGKRLAGRGVYYADCDGYESLTPAVLEALDADALARLRDEARETPGAARLVEDTAWYYAALFNGGETPEPGKCRLRFAGFDRSVPARLLEVRETGGRPLLLFRLTEGGEYLRIRFIEAEIERS